MTNGIIEMLAQLESHRLEVVLVPLNPKMRGYNEGGMKRVCADKNPRWYSSFCSRHPSSRRRNHRKHDTKIKRASIVRILARLVGGKPSVSKYVPELRRIAEKVQP